MNLLIAVDSPISTEKLLSAVMVQPWPSGTTANLLSVVVDSEIPEEVWREEGYGNRAVRREMKRRGEQIAALSVNRLKEVGIDAEVTVTRGDARHLIPVFARKWSSDIIFVGSHIIKSFEHWMLGSVARAVVATAPCTVQIVREQAKDRAHNLNRGLKVLVATDGSESSAEAARAVIARLWPKGSEFRVISVEEPWSIKTSSDKLEEAQETVSNAKDVLSSAGLRVDGAVLSGNTKEAILRHAQQWEADLIVVGSHGRRGVKRFLLGSVSEAVAMNAHCSVAVVRGSGKSAT